MHGRPVCLQGTSSPTYQSISWNGLVEARGSFLSNMQVSANLSNGAGHPTFDAYASTAVHVYGVSDDHYCCRQWSMGCSTRRVHGVFDPVVATAAGAKSVEARLHGWAWDDGAAKGGSEPISVRVSATT